MYDTDKNVERVNMYHEVKIPEAKYARTGAGSPPPNSPRRNNSDTSLIYSKKELINRLITLLVSFREEKNLIQATIERINSLLKTKDENTQKELNDIKKQLEKQISNKEKNNLIDLNNQLLNELEDLEDIRYERVTKSTYETVMEVIQRGQTYLKNNTAIKKINMVNELEKRRNKNQQLKNLDELTVSLQNIINDVTISMPYDIPIGNKIREISDMISALKKGEYINNSQIQYIQSRINACKKLIASTKTKISNATSKKNEVYKKYEVFITKYYEMLRMLEKSDHKAKEKLLKSFKSIDSRSDEVYVAYLEVLPDIRKSQTIEHECTKVTTFERECNRLIKEFEPLIDEAISTLSKYQKLEEAKKNVTEKEPVTNKPKNINHKAELVKTMQLFLRLGITDEKAAKFAHRRPNFNEKDSTMLNRLFTAITSTPPEKINESDLYEVTRLLETMNPYDHSNKDSKEEEEKYQQFEDYINGLSERKNPTR